MKFQEKLSGYMIVVLDRGYIYVGDVDYSESGCFIKNAKNIRRWGTTKGLGQLATEGPKTETKIDVVGDVFAPINSVIHLISTEKGLWT